MSAEIESTVEAAIRANYAGSSKPGLQSSLRAYVEALMEANRGINLVSRKDTLTHVGRFLRESLFLGRILEAEPSRGDNPPALLDLGSGGGFPGIVLKLALPEAKTTLVEGTLKKARFLAQVCQQLDLKGVQVLWGRAEVLSNREAPEFRRDLRHAFDWVTAKGLGSVRASLDLAVPYTRPKGVHWTFKGPGYKEELSHCRRRLAQLHFQVYRVERIPGDQASVVLGLQRQPQERPVSRETPARPRRGE